MRSNRSAAGEYANRDDRVPKEKLRLKTRTSWSRFAALTFSIQNVEEFFDVGVVLGAQIATRKEVEVVVLAAVALEAVAQSRVERARGADEPGDEGAVILIALCGRDVARVPLLPRRERCGAGHTAVDDANDRVGCALHRRRNSGGAKTCPGRCRSGLQHRREVDGAHERLLGQEAEKVLVASHIEVSLRSFEVRRAAKTPTSRPLCHRRGTAVRRGVLRVW